MRSTCDNHNGQEDRQCAPASPPSAIVPPVRCSYAHEVAQVWIPLKIFFQGFLDALVSEFLVLLLGFHPCSHLHLQEEHLLCQTTPSC